MALVSCVECGNQVSDQASNCPKCGYPLGKKTKTQSKSGLDSNSSFLSFYKSLWFHPRNTIRTILDLKPGYAVWGILGAYVVIDALDPNHAFFMTSWFGFPSAIPVAIITFALVGLAGFWGLAWLFYRVGKM